MVEEEHHLHGVKAVEFVQAAQISEELTVGGASL